MTLSPSFEMVARSQAALVEVLQIWVQSPAAAGFAGWSTTGAPNPADAVNSAAEIAEQLRRAGRRPLGVYEQALKDVGELQRAVAEVTPAAWFSTTAAALADSTRAMAALPQLVNGLLETAETASAVLGQLPAESMAEARGLMRDVTALVEQVEETVRLGRQRMGEFDLDGIASRVSGVEQAILNIEKAILNLDRTVEGSIESLPNFMARRARQEGRKIDPTRQPGEAPQEAT